MTSMINFVESFFSNKQFLKKKIEYWISTAKLKWIQTKCKCQNMFIENKHKLFLMTILARNIYLIYKKVDQRLSQSSF